MSIGIDYRKLGYRVRVARETKRLTQEQLAEITGLSNNYISNIERSCSIPSIETLVKICNSLDVTPDYILLDSIYCAREYLRDDIAKQLSKCTDKSLRMVLKFIELVIEEQ